MNNKKLSNIVKDRIEEQSDEIRPFYYTIVGSRMFGIEKEDSDYDVRGFHIAPIENYGKLTQPQERIKFEKSYDFGDVEMISYELRTFCSHILKGDFNIVEMLFLDSEYIIFSEFDKQINQLKCILNLYLPMNLPEKYMGMVKSHYHRYVESNSFKPKRYLHLIRGILSTKYLLKNNKLNPSMDFLIEEELWKDDDDKELIKKLIESREKNNMRYHERNKLERNAHQLIDKLMNYQILNFSNKKYDRGSLEEDLNMWMDGIRFINSLEE